MPNYRGWEDTSAFEARARVSFGVVHVSEVLDDGLQGGFDHFVQLVLGLYNEKIEEEDVTSIGERVGVEEPLRALDKKEGEAVHVGG